MRWWLSPMLVVMMGDCLAAEAIPQPADYPQSLQRDLRALLDAHAQEPRNPEVLTHLAALYLDMGDNLFNDVASRLAAYEEGARIARRALESQEANAEAHFLYAANLGTAAQLKGLPASALAVREIKAHTARALELHKTHAPALHMMGMLLEELPWFLGGDPAAALLHVTQAVAIAPGFTHARLDLAKLYLKRGDAESAKRELRAIVNMERPDDPYAWTHRDRPEAIELLRTLETGHARNGRR